MAFILFLLLPSTLLAKSSEVEKTIEKSFTISNTGSLTIENQFGKIDLITHDKNTVEVVVNITVDANNVDKSLKKLEQIDVVFKSTPNSVEMKTNFGGGKNNFNGSFSIDYTVKAPASLSLDINNQFGDVLIGEWKGKTNINVGYGTLTAGKLMAEDNELTLEFSKGSVGLINKGNVELSYSDRFNLDKAKELSIRSSFSDYEIQTVERLYCRSEYDDVEIENVNRIELDASFTSVKIGKIFIYGDITNEYGSVKINMISKGFEGLKVENSFAGIKVNFEKDAKFTFECDAEFGDISIPSGSYVKIDKKDMSEQYLEGNYGSGDNLPNVSIEVDYGSASLNID